MARRTLKTCWKQYEKLSLTYLEQEDKRAVALDKLHTLTFKANGDRIGDAISALFVRPFISDPTTVAFSTNVEDGVPKWQTAFEPEASRLLIHPISVFQFISECRSIELDDEIRADPLRSRYMSFLMETGKLPSIYILFLLVLQRVAYVLEIAHLEKRGGVVEIAEGEPYHTLLWAFKELENFARRTYGVNIRAHFGISWYESDWITGR